MAKRYELSIKASYLTNWGIYQACRELLQNSRDSEVQYGAPMSVSYLERIRNGEKQGAVVIANKGVTIPREALLIGHTTKDGDSRLIGKFGEGFKFGILALLRHGVEVKIRNGSEVWCPKIDHSNDFNADVLVFDVTTGHKQEDRVQIEVVGISEDDWKDIKFKTLFLDTYPLGSIETPYGHILTSPEHVGHIFVKGMWVSKTEYTFGYDFRNADIDRDRRMVSDLSSLTGKLLAEAVNEGKLKDRVFRLMKEGAQEAAYVSQYNLSDRGRKAIADSFKAENADAVVVENSTQQRELEAFGKRGIQVGWSLRGIIESIETPVNTLLKELRTSASKTHEITDLRQEEVTNLHRAVGLVARARKRLCDIDLMIGDISIVEFTKKDLHGTYNTETGKINLSRGILNDPGKTLYTLIHEAAHNHGNDGFVTHEQAIGALSEIVMNELIAKAGLS